ncbi:unnamed protein product [Caenorhabditis angaria]|uniref:Ras-related protein Rab-28 n=1 Tax=Caenorhabditis angaria TaxID=860376 RepID=A0A9P1INU4_9PELO|nr:unnamed protein product [Caenorhabditis angaria]
MSDDEQDEEKVLKLVLVGDGASGKTSICQRFAKETFDKAYHQTLGLDFFSRRLMFPNDVQVLVQVWDIGGQSIAGEMVDKYVNGANIVILVYDVTNGKSFDNVQDWLSLCRRVLDGQPKPPTFVLLGNKTDLEEKRVVSVEAHNTFCSSNELTPAYVSAKSGDTVLLVFRQAVADELKISMTKADVEADIAIVQGTVAEVVKSDMIPPVRKTDQSRNTSVCTIS